MTQSMTYSKRTNNKTAAITKAGIQHLKAGGGTGSPISGVFSPPPRRRPVSASKLLRRTVDAGRGIGRRECDEIGVHCSYQMDQIWQNRGKVLGYARMQTDDNKSTATHVRD